MTIAFPLALIFPLLFLWAYLRLLLASRASIPYPSIKPLRDTPKSLRLRLRGPILTILSLLLAALLSVVAARPQLRGASIDESKAPNIILALDVSRSMETQDFDSGRYMVPRMDGVKAVVGSFLETRKSDRIGIVIFGNTALLKAPLTKDHDFLLRAVSTLSVGMAGDGTAIGDALALSLKRIVELPQGSKTIVLLTDGVNTAGKRNPIEVSGYAKEAKVKIHTIGIGSTDTRVRLGARGFLSPQLLQAAEFDEATLKEIAENTGGVYFNASSSETLKKVYEEIDLLEGTSSSEEREITLKEYFPPFLLAAFLTLLFLIAVSYKTFLAVP